MRRFSVVFPRRLVVAVRPLREREEAIAVDVNLALVGDPLLGIIGKEAKHVDVFKAEFVLLCVVGAVDCGVRAGL